MSKFNLDNLKKRCANPNMPTSYFFGINQGEQRKREYTVDEACEMVSEVNADLRLVLESNGTKVASRSLLNNLEDIIKRFFRYSQNS